MTELPPEPDEDEGPLEEALSMVECIADELAEAREAVDLADSMLADLRALLDSGALQDSDDG